MSTEHSAPVSSGTTWRAYEALLGTTPDLLYVFDLQHRFIYANQALLTMWGMTWEQAQGKTCLEIGYEPWHAAMHDEEIDRVIATRQPIRGDVPFPHAEKGVRVYDYIFTPVIGLNGEVEAIAGSTRDVTERKQQEQRMQLMVNELNHRVKNSLVMIQSLIRQSMRGSSGMQEAQEKIDARILALSTTHNVLTREGWHSADLTEIVSCAIAPYAVEEGRFQISGGSCRLSPHKAVALSMALHELCSNALKYGALSVPEGTVRIAWQRDVSAAAKGKGMVLDWQEAGGPVPRPDSVKGFGTRLLEQGLSHDLGGATVLAFAPEGVRYSAQIPLEEVEETSHP
jgi:PAS domain S-box-containing protein